MALLNNVSKIVADDKCRRNFRIYFLLALRVKAYMCCFTQFTVDQSKLTVNGSVLSDTPNVRYLVALYHEETHESHLNVTGVHFFRLPI